MRRCPWLKYNKEKQEMSLDCQKLQDKRLSRAKINSNCRKL